MPYYLLGYASPASSGLRIDQIDNSLSNAVSKFFLLFVFFCFFFNFAAICTVTYLLFPAVVCLLHSWSISTFTIMYLKVHLLRRGKPSVGDYTGSNIIYVEGSGYSTYDI